MIFAKRSRQPQMRRVASRPRSRLTSRPALQNLAQFDLSYYAIHPSNQLSDAFGKIQPYQTTASVHFQGNLQRNHRAKHKGIRRRSYSEAHRCIEPTARQFSSRILSPSGIRSSTLAHGSGRGG